MPTYVYRRADGTTFEIEQRITEPALETCPTTGQSVQRVISGAGLIFKGSGFYLTDYARKSNGASSSSASSPNGESSGSKSESTASKETTKSAKTD